jgi:hypothetical protein
VLALGIGQGTHKKWWHHAIYCNKSQSTSSGHTLVSFGAARYMAAFQLEHTASAWDPFFSTETILLSDVSKAWPISDAGFGTLAYLLEALSGFMGGVRRWRTMLWMVLMFGVLIVPLGTVSTFLVISQPVLVGEWGTLCLLTAALMLLMIPLAVDEVLAMLQFMRAARREGQPLLRTFFVGGMLRQDKHNTNQPESRYTCPMHPDVVADRPGRCLVVAWRWNPCPLKCLEAATTPGRLIGPLPFTGCSRPWSGVSLSYGT